MAFAGDAPRLYDTASLESAPETLPLEGILRRYIQEGHKHLRIAFPGAIAAVEADQTVDVQPLLQVRYAGADPSDMPQIKAVPVVMPQGGDWRISYPLAVGDTGLVIVTDRSLDNWLAGQGGTTDPLDTRCHHLADAVFVPGLVPTALQTTDTATDMVLQNGATTLRLQKNGHFKVNNTTQELVAVLSASTQAFISTLQAIEQLQCLTAFGPAPLLASSIAQFTQIQAQVQTILNNLNTFKG
jgi:hypothetical protein